MQKAVRTGLIIAVVLLSALSAWLAIEFTRNKRYIEDLQLELGVERNLKVSLQKDMSAEKDELEIIKAELDNTRKQLKEVNAKLKRAETNNINLLEEKKLLEARLHSLKELKKAIRQVKIEMRQKRRQEYLARKELQRQIDAIELAQGNHGFFIKEGKSTYKPAVKIEVRPGN